MEITSSEKSFEMFISKKINDTEKLIKTTRQKLNMQMPKLWQIKQMQYYYRNMKEIKTKIKHLEWLLNEMQLVHQNTYID